MSNPTDQPERRPRKQKAVTQALRDIADRLTEVAIFECNPAYWTGNDANGNTMKPNAMIDKALDMRIKCKINARATIGLLKDLQQAINQRETGRTAQRLNQNPDTGGDEDTVDRMAQAAAEAAEKHIALSKNVVRLRKKA